MIDIYQKDSTAPSQPTSQSTETPPSQPPTAAPPPPVESPKIPGTPIAESRMPEEETVKKEPLKKYIIFFLLGLLLPILGFIIGANWIIFAEKQKRLWKLTFLLFGSILSIILIFTAFGGIDYIRTYYL